MKQHSTEGYRKMGNITTYIFNILYFGDRASWYNSNK